MCVKLNYMRSTTVKTDARHVMVYQALATGDILQDALRQKEPDSRKRLRDRYPPLGIKIWFCRLVIDAVALNRLW